MIAKEVAWLHVKTADDWVRRAKKDLTKAVLAGDSRGLVSHYRGMLSVALEDRREAWAVYQPAKKAKR